MPAKSVMPDQEAVQLAMDAIPDWDERATGRGSCARPRIPPPASRPLGYDRNNLATPRASVPSFGGFHGTVYLHAEKAVAAVAARYGTFVGLPVALAA